MPPLQTTLRNQMRRKKRLVGIALFQKPTQNIDGITVHACKIHRKEHLRKYTKDYNQRRYREDPEFHKKVNEIQRKYFAKRYRNDPEFRERVLRRNRERSRAKKEKKND